MKKRSKSGAEAIWLRWALFAVLLGHGTLALQQLSTRAQWAEEAELARWGEDALSATCEESHLGWAAALARTEAKVERIALLQLRREVAEVGSSAASVALNTTLALGGLVLVILALLRRIQRLVALPSSGEVDDVRRGD